MSVKRTSEPVLLSGTAHPELAIAVSKLLAVQLGALLVERFPDGETYARVETSVDDRDVFLIQATSPPVNENLAELLITLDALRHSSPARVTAIIPYYGYARQDKRLVPGEGIAARLVADLLEAAGVNRLVTIDMHAPQIQGFFTIPVEDLSSVDLLAGRLSKEDLTDAVIVSPDEGRVGTAMRYADVLALPMAVIRKRRISPIETMAAQVIGDVRGRRPIIIDDMISTGGTIIHSVEALLERGAKPGMTVAVTHGIMSDGAWQRLRHTAISRVLVTDTVPQRVLGENGEVISIAPLLSDAIRSIHDAEAV